MSELPDVYSFVFRGQIAQDSISRQLSNQQTEASDFAQKVAERLPFDAIEKGLIESASKMAAVYTVIAAFENSARKFVSERLLEEKGAGWWEECVSQDIRNKADKRKDDEELHRYHGSRGKSMINYCEMGDLPKIINNNNDFFTDYLPSSEWARQIFQAVERSRNVIMHSGELSLNDVERVAMNIRDWLQQVGG